MYILAILLALLFTFGMCWLAILNQTTISIVLPPGANTLEAYVWEVILASAAASAVLIGLIALVKGSAHRSWEKEMERRMEELGRKLDGLAGKVEEMELKMSIPPQKAEEEVEMGSGVSREGEG